MCLSCCNASIQNAGRSFINNNAAYSSSGSISKDTKFDGPSRTDQEFEMTKSSSDNSSKLGWS